MGHQPCSTSSSLLMPSEHHSLSSGSNKCRREQINRKASSRILWLQVSSNGEDVGTSAEIILRLTCDSAADSKVHDLDPTIERSAPEASPLSNLPFELRQEIYLYIFHDHTNNQYCEDFHLKLGNLGCRCGRGLSRVNYFFYNETRARYYQCARFVFTKPEACKNFLDIGSITKSLGNLSITYKDEYSQASLLRGIFNDIAYSPCLHSLHLRIIANDARFPFLPVYMPRADKRGNAEMYDLSLRSVKHPLGDLRCARHLIVQGQPGAEIEEALFQLTIKIRELAEREGKRLQIKSQWRPAFGEWFYEIQIIE